jgi:sugar lactone lactonase YvrE
MAQLIDIVRVEMEIGECPLWDHRCNRLYWADILRCNLFELDWTSGALRNWPLPSLGGGLALHGSDEILVAVQTGLFRFNPSSGLYQFITRPEAGIPSNRLNEGKADAYGNFWVGSISALGARPEGSLYRVSPSGQTRRLLSGIHIPNALVFLPDEQVFFSDSHTKVCYQVDPISGELTNRQVFAGMVPSPTPRATSGTPSTAAVGSPFMDPWGIESMRCSCQPRKLRLARSVAPTWIIWQ